MAKQFYVPLIKNAVDGTVKNYIALVQPPFVPVSPTDVLVTSPGSGTFIVPENVIRLKVEVAGAGGGASDWGGSAYYERQVNGANGGRGGLTIAYLNVIPGSSLPLFVGTGGARGLSFYAEESYYYAIPNGSPGGNSSFNTNIVGLGGLGATGAWFENGGDSAYYGDSAHEGTSFGLGALGGTAGIFTPRTESTNGANGWVKISYGGDLQKQPAVPYIFAREVTT